MPSLFNKLRFTADVLAADASTVVLSCVAAGFEELSGRALELAHELSSECNTRFTVRWSTSITSSCYVSFEGVLYPIDWLRDPGVADPKPGEVRRGILLELYTHRVKDGVTPGTVPSGAVFAQELDGSTVHIRLNPVLSTALPPSPLLDEVVYCTDTDEVLIWSGTTWVEVSGSGPTGATGATGPAGPSPSGTPNQVLATDPSGSSSNTAALRALVAEDLPTSVMFSNTVIYPNPKLVNGRIAVSLPGAGTQNTMYTVPSGRKAVVSSCFVSTASGSPDSTYTMGVQFGGSGSVYAIGVATSVPNGTGATVNTTAAVIVLNAGDVLVILNATNTTFIALAQIVEFDSTSPVKSVRTNSFTGAGDTPIYTPSGSKNGMLVQIGGSSEVGTIVFTTASSNTVFMNYVPSGGSASTSNRLGASFSANAELVTNIPLILNGLVISNGDSLSMNNSAATVAGMVWVNAIEF